MPHHYFPDLIPAWGQHYSCGSQRSGKQKKKKKERWGLCGGVRERRERVRACLEVTQAWGIIINNLPSCLVHGRKVGERGAKGWGKSVGRVTRGLEPSLEGSTISLEKKKSKAQSVCYFLKFFFLSFSTAWGNSRVSTHKTVCEGKGIHHREKTSVFAGKEGRAP